jgi:DNA polymerase III epsilon subunit-like protein
VADIVVTTLKGVKMNNLDYIIFDLETGGLSELTSEAIQVAGKAFCGRTLSPYSPEEGGEFVSLMKPLYPEKLSPDALRVNKKTVEELMAAPEQRLVWNQFVDWVMRFNPKKSVWTAPIAGGKNIRSFDLKFVNVLNNLHCPKKDKTVLFNRRREVDLEDFIFHWFEGTNELENEKMDTLREYFGLPTDNAHDAMCDAAQSGDLIMRFLKLNRELRRRKNEKGDPFIKLAGACLPKQKKENV